MRCLFFVPRYVTAAMALLSAAGKEEAIFEPGARLEFESAPGSDGEGPVWHSRLGVLTRGNGHITNQSWLGPRDRPSPESRKCLNERRHVVLSRDLLRASNNTASRKR